VKLVGHDWGGWIGFLLCLKAPQRFERYLGLNILHPWLRGIRATLPYAWRFTCQLAIMAPIVGYASSRLTVPTRMLFGVEGVVLRPELVAGRARELFAPA
jgi:pimeloyl-ACP methyl ester carboxylesterase